MGKKFVIGIVFLFQLIPQNGNSPVPRMESSLRKEQDDGFLDRDMTSSLAGDESFGFARRSYQNALIRRKKSENSADALNPKETRKINQKTQDRAQREDEREEIDDAELENSEENKYSSRNEKAEPIFEEFEGDSEGFQNDKYRSRLTNKNQNDKTAVSSKYVNKFRGNENLIIVPQKDVLKYHRSDIGNDNSDNFRFNNRDSTFLRSDGGRAKSSLCRNSKGKFAPDITLGVMEVLKLEGGEKGKRQGGGEETSNLIDDYKTYEGGRRRIKNELNGQEQKTFLNKKGNQMLRKNEETQPVDDSYYDNADSRSSILQEESDESLQVDDDYNQLNDHGGVYKRDDVKQSDKGVVKEVAEMSFRSDIPIKEGNQMKYRNDVFSNDMSKDTEKSNGDLVRRSNNNVQAEDLNDVMRDSQRALEEVQLLQQKLALKSSNNVPVQEVKRESSPSKQKIRPDDRRSKREDEDEQKNMKTGTDEGGGEYEDEEGKGHNDEEEYYEEADLSEEDDRSQKERNSLQDNNRRSFKRNADEGSQINPPAKSAREDKPVSAAEDDDEDEEDELSIKNAPVENENDSNRMSKIEGEKNKKNVRKGVKIWDQWGKWSPCSVTCGVGRSVRWRHCIGGGCAQGEKEAQIKKCTNPAC